MLYDELTVYLKDSMKATVPA